MEHENSSEQVIKLGKEVPETHQPPRGTRRIILLLLITALLILTGLGGFILGTRKQPEPPTAPPLNTQRQPSPSQAQDETANWKTYINEQLGFGLKYPEDFNYIDETETKILIAKDRLGSDGIKIVTEKNPEFIDINSLKSCDTVDKNIKLGSRVRPSCLDSGQKFGQTTDLEKIQLSRREVLSFYLTSTGRGGTFHVYQTTSNPIIQISQVDPSDKLFDQILSTFRFDELTTSKFLNQREEKVSTNTRMVKLFYYNTRKDPRSDCAAEAVVAVEREIPISNTPIQDTIALLLKGNLTVAEKAQGFTTEFPHTQFTLQSLNLKRGILTLTFPDVPGFTTGGSCRVGLLREQIVKTAKQFPEVKEVVFLPEIFQP